MNLGTMLPVRRGLDARSRDQNEGSERVDGNVPLRRQMPTSTPSQVGRRIVLMRSLYVLDQ